MVHTALPLYHGQYMKAELLETDILTVYLPTFGPFGKVSPQRPIFRHIPVNLLILVLFSPAHLDLQSYGLRVDEVAPGNRNTDKDGVMNVMSRLVRIGLCRLPWHMG